MVLSVSVRLCCPLRPVHACLRSAAFSMQSTSPTGAFPRLSELFHQGRDFNGIFRLVSKQFLDPTVNKPPFLGVTENAGLVDGIGVCRWTLLVDSRPFLAPPDPSHSAETQVLSELMQLMSPKLSGEMPDGAKEIQIALLRRIVFDPEKSQIWSTMQALAEGPKEICDIIAEAEKSRGDEWCANFVKRLEESRGKPS